MAYSEDIEKHYNMKHKTYEDDVYYVRCEGRKPNHIYTEKKPLDGYEQTLEVYELPTT